MKKTKQILSVFLSVCMIISCMVGMSVTASAANNYDVIDAYTQVSSIKQGDTIYGMFNPSMPDDEFKYVLGAVITIKPAGGGADIATRKSNWTADADYNITTREQIKYDKDHLGPYASEYGGYEVDIIEYIFTVQTATPATSETETLLTTITPTGQTTYSETTSGVVTVSHNNDTYYDEYGWIWKRTTDTLTVSGCEGYTITKVIFKQNEKSPVTDSSAPFELHFERSRCQENRDMDGVTSIEVYGYASTPATTTGGFVKVTDESQITEDNIGEATEAEARAWIKANLTTLQSEQDSYFDFFFKENGTLKKLDLPYYQLNETDLNNRTFSNGTIGAALGWFNNGDKVYFWSGSSTPSTPTPPTVAVSPEGAGTASVEEDPANSDNWLFTATPNEGYKFKWWALDHSNAPTGKYLTNTTSIVKTNFTESAGNNMITGITAVFEEAKYSITMPNGGTASVDGNTVTEATKGATVTIVAPDAEPGTEFNGWTSTSEGVTFEDASKATTTFTMPANDVTISASFQNIAYNITMPNGGTASVDGNTVTEAEKGAIVTISAPEAEPGTEFNGWTSTSEGVTFEDASKATTKFTMPANDVTISASFQNIAYNITMLNGGTAYVDGKPATTAEAGTVVTIKANSSVSTPARFNGWTTTTEGVEFADADSPETTFVMPISDVTITASFEGVTPYVPSHSTGTSTTTSSGTASSVDSASSKAKMWAVQNDDKSSITVGWEKVNGASLYSLYVRKDGELKKVVDTKKTKVLIKNPANNTNLEYVLKYTIGGVESGENSAYTASIKVYYKPAVKASSKDGAVILKWNKVDGAEKYRVYKYTGGKLVKVADTEANAVRLKNVTTGKTYKYAVKAYVDGKWTKVTSKDIVSVKVK